MRARLTSAVLTLALLAAPAHAEIRAVVVGVSDYLTLDADLKGPANDARLMAETLALRGVAPGNITVLTSDPTGLPQGTTTGQPIRAEILIALAAATQASATGDTIVFTFSGHGAQAPDLSGDEGGGYDELLLPADAAGWKGAIGSVENALVDDDLQAWAQQTLAKGIQVVALIDACHSATGFRAIGGQGVAKVIDEAQLGIPDEVTPVAGKPSPPLEGEFVFLYSSQSDQRSFEYPMPDGTWHGEFTLRLAQTLRDTTDASWAQVLTATTEAMVQGPAKQMPDGEGPLLLAPVFGTGPTTQRFPIANGTLTAGLLDGLTDGTELALFATPTGGSPLATGILTKVAARTATLTAPPDALWAEVASAPPPAPLTLAAPVLADPADPVDYSRWTAALPPPGLNPDLVPILTDGTIALANADGVLDPDGAHSSPRIRAEPGETEAQAVTRTLEQAAHGLALRKVLAGATGRSLTGKAALTVTTERRAATADCGTAAGPQPFDPANGVAPCDQLWLTITNTSGTAQDVSVLYFTADFQVQPIWPSQNLSNRLAPGETTRVGLMIEPDSTAGLEEIWTLAVPASPDAPRVDLTRLAPLQGTRAYAGASDPMALWLEARIDPDASNRGFTLKPAPLTMIRQLVRLTPGPTTPAPMEN